MMKSPRFIKIIVFHTFRKNYSVKVYNPADLAWSRKIKKLAEEGIKKTINVEVEKDVKKLASEVCGTNLYVEGGENIKIKPDSEYPDWLWKVHLGEELKLEDMDPNTKAYWERVNLLGQQKEEYLLKFQKHKTLQK